MSTKATLAHDKTWHLYEEMCSGEVELEMNDASDAKIHVGRRWHAVIVTLPPEVLDAIGQAHAAKGLPHQRHEFLFKSRNCSTCWSLPGCEQARSGGPDGWPCWKETPKEAPGNCGEET